MKKIHGIATGCRSLFFILLFILPGMVVQAAPHTLAKISVHTGSNTYFDTPLTVSLEGLNPGIQKDAFRLIETTDGVSVPVTAQLKPGNPDRLAWILEGETPAQTVRTYSLQRIEPSDTPMAATPEVFLQDDGDDLRVIIGDKPVLNYRYTLKDVPEGVDPIFRRSGFIHPLWTPEGTRLTRIQPSGHYHHYGIWNPWTHTEFDGNEIDFWNLRKNQGTVIARQPYERLNGKILGGFKALHDHVLIKGPTGTQTALNEQWIVDVWKADPENSYWIVDFTSVISAATSEPLTIKEYRYQGFSLRANEAWDDSNTQILTSEGYDKSNANATRARWIDVRGPSSAKEHTGDATGTSGILMMTHPSNFNFPEQLRIWPVGASSGTENVFINFNPAQDRDLIIEPGNTYAFKYRMIIYDGILGDDQSERFWKNYAEPPRIVLEPVRH